jgi:hypothetical protein
VASSSIHEERPVLKTMIVREWLYAVGGLMAGFVFTVLTQPHDYATGWLALLAPYVVFQSIRCSVRTAKVLGTSDQQTGPLLRCAYVIASRLPHSGAGWNCSQFPELKSKRQYAPVKC